MLKPQPKFVYKLDGFKIDSSVDFWRMGLSIDGGGIRGLVPATIINILSDKLKKEPFEIFDYVGGTSIGGIIALALTGTQDYKQPIGDHNEIVKIFTEYGKNIFDRSAFVGNFYNLIDKCKYNPKGIEDVL